MSDSTHAAQPDQPQQPELTTAVTGEHTTNGTPTGYSTITPFIAVADPGAALDFYADVFGARVVNRTEMGGQVVHAEVELGNGRLQLGAPQEAYGLVAPSEEDRTSFSLAIYCPDADAVIARAEAAGATVREPLMTFVSGDRYGSVRDPFGVRWSVMTRVEDLSDEESDARVKEWAAQQG